MISDDFKGYFNEQFMECYAVYYCSYTPLYMAWRLAVTIQVIMDNV